MRSFDDQVAAKPQAWLLQHERSSVFAIRLLVALTLTLGRRVGRMLLHPVAAYFLMFGPSARLASRSYLTRVLGRPPALSEVYRHFYTFATVSLDRVFLLKDHFSRFEIKVYGMETLLTALDSGQGRLMMGGHVGSFEALRILGVEQPVSVNLVMYEDNARNIIRVCKAIDPELVDRIISLGRFDSMLRVSDSLARNEWVGVLADRALTQEGQHQTPFLGTVASFPIAPFRMAALMKREVVFMVALYRGGNRYDLHFETLIDEKELRRRDRDVAMREWVQRYAERLEHYVRLAPYNWFNFYDFWDEHAAEVH